MVCETEHTARESAAATLIEKTIAKATADANQLIASLEFTAAVEFYQQQDAAYQACLLAASEAPPETPPPPGP